MNLLYRLVVLAVEATELLLIRRQRTWRGDRAELDRRYPARAALIEPGLHSL